ncbi:hypothetical protein A2U94_09695 [Bacillus sp. VT 712]|uniref:MarR family transcriptional regulator n=1 Tax=Bacillaceae TaxID=186817 RepID=UPI000473BDD3|nr:MULTISPECIES: MarR family transcriptional regulator [Bacillaceae]KZB91745.1 hypothetical protein A2U94_09695 [Bacillus sp. VT 712]
MYYTQTQIAEELKIPKSTLSDRIKRFGALIDTTYEDGKISYTECAKDQMKLIEYAYQNKYSNSDIKLELSALLVAYKTIHKVQQMKI